MLLKSLGLTSNVQGDKDDMGLLNKGGLTRLSYQSLTVHTSLVAFVKVFLSSESHSLKETTSKEMSGIKSDILFGSYVQSLCTWCCSPFVFHCSFEKKSLFDFLAKVKHYFK